MSEGAFPRVLGVHEGRAPGPLVIVTGGVHGNEPAGVHAVRRVLAQLQARAMPLRGTLMGVAGNRAGLDRKVRYLDRDLNRRWLVPEMIALLARDPAQDSPEDREQRELLHLFAPLCARARAPIVFLDLHSTSGDGAPFVCMADVLRNRTIAFALGIPVVLGLEEVIDGSMIGFFTDIGHIGVAVEGGQHDDPRSVDCHEAAIWIALVAAGALAEAEVPGLDRHRATLEEATRGLPRVLEIRHRHVVADDDDFVMRPGFANFQPVGDGQVVAEDRGGDVRTPEAGIMMLPRYQGQGEDGYFLARQVSRLWLTLSAGLRLARADRLVTMLPGVARHPELGDHMLVERDRPRAIDVFHLLGFRHQRAHAEDRYAFSRRRPAFTTIDRLPAAVREMIERLVAASAG